MISEYNEKGTLGRFVMHHNNKLLSGSGLRKNDPEPINTFIYNKGAAQQVKIDEVTYLMPEASILPLVSNQHFQFERPGELVAWQFNREFYCILNHDAEVGCVGFLFYGIHHPMFIKLEPAETDEMQHLLQVFSSEMQVRDNFQGEMLRTLLKRVIIKTTRIAKQQCESYQLFPDEKMDLIRKFSLILEGNFKKEHEVKFYAAALNKSPKTLSNTFALLKQPAPSVLIRNRIILEAKRYLHYTDKSAKEIAYELGFESPAHFSRFFKQQTGSNTSEFKTTEQND
ncbi:AraC family transcriptional regulator [Olivibacter domesticus]|uniref:Transcriptional regulator, AraC family n=1 Tax=Olivibacter domesticus TaxID=407022 RepID=A0A1H7H0G1_OLID1|nr:helix-turn-helix domain-containing protein [Olivibacter domesticus]SEK43801.1 transcriptional regulator, AraC family [Olivibacter domesticus]